MTKAYFWRTVINDAVYVDSNSGDDINGDGTQQNPYQTLGKAYRTSTVKPRIIICRGYFSEDMADGNHACNIYGEYPGAAIFDGNEQYTLYGFTTYNMIIKNCIPGNATMTVYSNNSLYAGVGRAAYAAGVGAADGAAYFPGLLGSLNIVLNCGMYFGHVGGSGSNNVISNPRHNSTYPIFLWGNTLPKNNCIHGIKKEDRTKSKNSTATGNNFYDSIFTDVAFYINDHIQFSNCYFDNDCIWWDNNTEEQIIIEGNTSEEKIAFLENKMKELGAENTNCTFIDCVFIDKNASQIYNNHELGDFTTKPNSGIPSTVGAFGPALNVAIKDIKELDSNGDDVTNMWDPGSATGLIKIEDNQIVLNENTDADYGEVCTGIIEVDPEKFNIKSLYTELATQFNKHIILNKLSTHPDIAYPNSNPIIGNTIKIGEPIPIGKYIVKGNLLYNGMPYKEDDILTIILPDTTFERDPDRESNNTPSLLELLDPNIEAAVYMRGFSSILNVEQGDHFELEENGVYVVLEQGGSIYAEDSPLTRDFYKGSVIEGVNSKYINLPNRYSEIWGFNGKSKLGRLASLNNDWIPCQSNGGLFIVREGNGIKRDEDNVPLGSGNPNSYQSNSNRGQVKSGYKDVPLNYKYQQFKIVAKKVW